VFIEARDAILAVVALPCLPSELMREGASLAPLLTERPRARKDQLTHLASAPTLS
jgi:hypothetical protein